MGYHLDTAVLVPKKEAERIKEKEKKKKSKQLRVFGFVISGGKMLNEVGVTNLRTKERVKTDENGRYWIHAKPEDILHFSAAGYQTKQFKIGKNTTLNVILKQEGR